MNPCEVIVKKKTLRKDCLKKNALWETALRAAVEMKSTFFESAAEPVQNSGTQSKELLIGHRRRDETTQNSLGALSESELCSASSINQGVSSWDVLPCSWIHSVQLLWKEISKPFGSMWSLRIRSRHLTKLQKANYMSNSSGSMGFRSNFNITFVFIFKKESKRRTSFRYLFQVGVNRKSGIIEPSFFVRLGRAKKEISDIAEGNKLNLKKQTSAFFYKMILSRIQNIFIRYFIGQG